MPEYGRMKFCHTIIFKRLIFILLLLPNLQQIVRAQTKNTGKIAGRVLDAGTNEPIFGAAAIVKSLNVGATTDFDGKFQMSVAPGTYELEVKFLGYQAQILPNVQVGLNDTKTLTVYLSVQTLQTKAVEVVADVSNNNDNALLKEQRASNSINSGVSAELLSKTPDRNLSESFRRISGTSIREGKFAMVRGLSERYNMGQLNGVSIPSTESDRKAFSLELFPSNLIDKIVVSKTATPDQPGDIAGGLIKIQTLDIPYSNSLQVTLGAEHHSLTTGKDFAQINKSSTDWLGFDNGLRQIPNGVSSTDDNNSSQNAQLKASQSLAFNHNVTSKNKNAAPNFSAQVSVGRRGKVFGKTAGLIASINYYKTQLRNKFYYYFPSYSPGEPITEFISTDQDRYKTTSSISTVLNGSIKPTSSTKIYLRNFYSQTGSNQSQFTQYSNINQVDSAVSEYVDKKSIVSFYEQSSLVSSQLGFDKFFGTDGTKLEIIAGGNLFYRSTPDYSRLYYDRSGNDTIGKVKQQQYTATLGNLPPVSFNQDLSGKFFSNLQEISLSPSVNFTAPFTVHKIKNNFKTGLMYQTRNRTFSGRNYLYTKGNGASRILHQPADSIFRNENFGADLLTLSETTLNSDFYEAETGLQAAYIMNETHFDSKGSRIIYGVRYESYYQSITAAPQGKGPRQTIESTVGDWFPSVNLNLNLSSTFTLRAAYAHTVNRPELRELAGFTFFEPSQNVYYYGNPNLVRAKIRNMDLKLEYYPNQSTFLSLNGFYKKFWNPIEVTRGSVTTLPTFTYSNRDNATSYGAELEGKLRFNFLDSAFHSKFFSGLSVFSNFSWIRSEVVYAQTNFKRPIHGQSPYIINAGIQYSDEKTALDFLFTYNRIGPRVAFLDDQNFGALIWEKPRDVIDFSIGKTYKKFNFKLIAGDLLSQELIQYIVLDRGNRKPDQSGLFGWVSNVPKYQKGQDIPYFRFTNGRTIRFAITWKISS